jgi:phosphatidate cytidylyltransferase
MSDSLGQRVITAAVLAPLAVAAVLWTPTRVFSALLGAAFLLGLWEWARLAGLRSRPLRALLLALGAGSMLALSLADAREPLLTLVGAGLLGWLLACLWLGHFGFAAEPTPGHRALKLGAGVLLVLAAWAALVLLHGQPHGPWWTLYALALVWVADIGAYFAGRAFGRRKLAPSISPGKTWAGVWGALAAAALLALTAGFAGFGLQGWPLAGLLLLTLVAVAFSIVGDLFESLLKRHAHSKDSGALLPGHGGVLDRIDSILAATPVFAAGKLLMGL